MKHDKELEDILGKENVKYNEPMKMHTSFKVGGNADRFLIIDSKEKLTKVLNLDLKNIYIIGNGTNILVRDKGIRGTVIKYVAKNYEINDNIIKVEAGMPNALLSKPILENSIEGLEFAFGIPGTIGGAIVMNAGAFGREMKDVVVSTTYIDLDTKKTETINNLEHEFRYRESIFSKKHAVILETMLKLEKGNREEIKKKIEEYREKRINTQPLDVPSAGSTFKRGEGYITAKLIDESGLKGFTIGGAKVSEKHAGFIVNAKNAKAEDIINLIEYVKQKVYEKFGKHIEEEIKIIGE